MECGGCGSRTHRTVPVLTASSINELKAFRLMIWIPVMRRVFPTNGNMALSTHNAGSLEAFTLKVSEALARSDGVPTEAEKGGAECGKKQNARDRERTRENASSLCVLATGCLFWRAGFRVRANATAENVLFQPCTMSGGVAATRLAPWINPRTSN